MGFGAHALARVDGEAVGVVSHRCPLRELDERRARRFCGAVMVAVLQHAGLLLWLAGLGDLEMSPAPPLVVSLDAVGFGSPGAGPGGPAGETRGSAAATLVETPLPAAPAAVEPPATIEVPPPPPPAEVVEPARPEPPVIRPVTPKPKPVDSKAKPPTSTASVERSSEIRGSGRPGTVVGEGQGTGAGPGLGSGTWTGSGGGTATVESDYRAHLVAWLARHKRYPARARAMGLEGRVVVRVTLARDGRVQSHRIEEDSAYSVLLHEVEAMVERADPFPAMPATLAGERFELRVPVDFRLGEPPARGGS